MKLEKIKKLVTTLNDASHKELFISLLIYEKMDYLQSLNDLTNEDITMLENTYNMYMNADYITGLINNDILELNEWLKEEEE